MPKKAMLTPMRTSTGIQDCILTMADRTMKFRELPSIVGDSLDRCPRDEDNGGPSALSRVESWLT